MRKEVTKILLAKVPALVDKILDEQVTLDEAATAALDEGKKKKKDAD
jgi:hypothetical protein